MRQDLPTAFGNRRRLATPDKTHTLSPRSTSHLESGGYGYCLRNLAAAAFVIAAFAGIASGPGTFVGKSGGTPPTCAISLVERDSELWVSVQWNAAKSPGFRLQSAADPATDTWTDVEGVIGPGVYETPVIDHAARYFRLRSGL